jgi:hypothetical protein
MSERHNSKGRKVRRKEIAKGAALSSEQSPAVSEPPEDSPLTASGKTGLEKVHINSLEMAALERGSVLRELQHAYLKYVAFLRSKEGGALSPDEARKRAYEHLDEEKAARVIARVTSMPVDTINFLQLSELWGASPQHAERLWQLVKLEAQEDFESGHMAANGFMPVEWMQEAWRKARYLGVRQSFVEEWQPRGGIELALIDMLAQSFFLYLHWTEESVKRAQTEPRREAEDYVKWKRAKKAEREVSGWGPGWWDIPYVCEQEALEHAVQMADRYNRLFLRTLRQLRDLRRYNVPVTINNPQQVNIAADGGQQVNVSNPSPTDLKT